MRNRLSYILIILLVVASSVATRFIHLDKVPASLYYDEIDFAYQVKSIVETGKDYRGGTNPLIIRSMNADRLPFPVYFSALISSFFQSPDYQVRAGAAAAGVISVVLATILVLQITNNKYTAALSGLIFAFSPWQI